MNRTNCKECLFVDECRVYDAECDYFAPVSDWDDEYIEQAREEHRAAWSSYLGRDNESTFDAISRIADKWNNIV